MAIVKQQPLGSLEKEVPVHKIGAQQGTPGLSIRQPGALHRHLLICITHTNPLGSSALVSEPALSVLSAYPFVRHTQELLRIFLPDANSTLQTRAI